MLDGGIDLHALNKIGEPGYHGVAMREDSPSTVYACPGAV